jgi:hypothetical protein
MIKKPSCNLLSSFQITPSLLLLLHEHNSLPILGVALQSWVSMKLQEQSMLLTSLFTYYMRIKGAE